MCGDGLGDAEERRREGVDALCLERLARKNALGRRGDLDAHTVPAEVS